MPVTQVPLPRFAAFVVALVPALLLARGASAQIAAPECSDPQTCRELALEARGRGAYETFHDLAWRAVQTGRPNDPDLMYLLARAQALSGRRRDAIVTLRRLAEAGFANDAATDEDFRRVRELADWAYVASLASRAQPSPPENPSSAAASRPSAAATPAASAAAKRTSSAAPPPAPATVRPSAAAPTPATAAPSSAPASAPSPSPAVAPPASASATPAIAPKALRVEAAVVEDAARFSTARFPAGGLAYDAVSRRFLFGDREGRRLFVVGEGSERTIDLVRAESAGFDQVTAIAIDPKRGDLWVASSSSSGTDAAVHRLQLISGRALAKFAVPGNGSARLNDLAVGADGTVFVLDSAAPRLLVLRPGATALTALMPLSAPEASSIAVDEDGRFGFVAHRDGITRLDLQARRAVPLNASAGITLGGFESARIHGDSLVAPQRQPDGTRGLVRLKLSRDRRIVTEATLVEAWPAEADGAALATISGADLYYIAAEGPASGAMNVRVRRIRLP